MSKALAGRLLGQFPLSIATSIAFESLFNLEPPSDAPPYVRRPKGNIKPITTYKVIWINLRTLLRNIDGAVSNEIQNLSSPLDYYRVLTSEMAIIDNLVGELPEESRPVIRYFTKNYENLTRIWSHALFRDVTAPRLQVYAALERNVMAYFAEDIKKGSFNSNKVVIADTFLNLDNKAALISHYPVDLLLTKGEKFIALVESHTGAIKEKAEWNTKLRDGSKYPRIPFDKSMVQIFGDKENMLSPQTIQIRKKLGELSEKYHWNPLTTRDRIVTTIEMENEPILLKLVKDCYR